MPGKLLFDEVKHQYTLDGVILPSVTQVLAGAGLIDLSGIPAERLEAARLFGIAAHRATALSDKKTLDEKKLDIHLQPYLAGWKLFCQEYGFVPKYIEVPMCSQKYRVAGTPDRIGNWRIDDCLIIPDIKTGFELSPANGIQLAGYELIVKEEIKPKVRIKRLSVLLNNEGTYKIKQHKDKSDINIFMAALSIYNFKKKNNLLKGER